MGLIRALYATIRPLKLNWEDGLTHVIFHGALGAVVRAGLAAVGQLTRDPQKSKNHNAAIPECPTDGRLDAPRLRAAHGPQSNFL